MSLPVSYAGADLPFGDAPECAGLRQWIATNIDYSYLVEFLERGWPGPGLAHLNWPGIRLPRGPVQVNRVYWPCDASRFAVGHFLASKEQIEAIRAVTQAGPQLAPATLTLGEQELQMYALPARPLSYMPDANNLWLLTLVDQRYFWWDRAYDVVVDEGTTTWTQLYAQILAGLQITATIDAIAGAYILPPKELNASYQPLPILFDACALSTGMRVVCTLAGDVRVMNAQNSLAILNANLALNTDDDLDQFAKVKGGGLFQFDSYDTQNDLASYLPESVTVAYPKYRNGVKVVDPEKKFAIEVPLSSFAAVPQLNGPHLKSYAGTHLARDVAKALYGDDITGDPIDLATLQDLTSQIALNYYLFRVGQKMTLNFHDFQTWDPEGMTDVIEYHWGGCTRVERSAWLDHNNELFHYIPVVYSGSSGSSASGSASGSSSVSGSISHSASASASASASGSSGYSGSSGGSLSGCCSLHLTPPGSAYSASGSSGSSGSASASASGSSGQSGSSGGSLSGCCSLHFPGGSGSTASGASGASGSLLGSTSGSIIASGSSGSNGSVASSAGSLSGCCSLHLTPSGSLSGSISGSYGYSESGSGSSGSGLQDSSGSIEFPVISDACGNCTILPYKWKVSLSGFTDGSCNCSILNGDFIVTWTGGIPDCNWNVLIAPFCTIGVATITLVYDSGVSKWTLQVLSPSGVEQTWTIDSADFNCLSTNVFTTKTINVNTICGAVPVSATITPYAG